MKFLKALIFLSGSIFLIGGCTYLVEELPYSDICKTNFHGFPDVPGWSYTAYHFDPAISGVPGIYFVNENKGFIYNNQAIWRTENQGLAWEKVYSKQWLSFKDFSFVDQMHGVASVIVDDEGYIIKTDDGGLTWSLTYTQTKNTIDQVSFRDSLVGFASFYRVGSSSNGNLYNAKTIDGGVTWQEIPELSGPESRATDIQFFPNGFGYMTGNKGEIHLTTDGGDTWATEQTGLNMLNHIQFIDRDIGFAADYSSLIKTIDGGKSWLRISENPILMFHFFSDLDGILFKIVSSGYPANADWPQHCNAFLTTSDGGITWDEGPVSINFYLRNYNFPNANLGFISYGGWPDGIVKLYR